MYSSPGHQTEKVVFILLMEVELTTFMLWAGRVETRKTHRTKKAKEPLQELCLKSELLTVDQKSNVNTQKFKDVFLRKLCAKGQIISNSSCYTSTNSVQFIISYWDLRSKFCVGLTWNSKDSMRPGNKLDKIDSEKVQVMKCLFPKNTQQRV